MDICLSCLLNILSVVTFHENLVYMISRSEHPLPVLWEKSIDTLIVHGVINARSEKATFKISLASFKSIGLIVPELHFQELI